MARTEQVDFTIAVESFDQSLAAKLSKARAEVASIEREICNAFGKSDRFRALQDIAGNHDMGGKRMVVPPIIVGMHIKAQTVVDVAEKAPAPPAYFNITEKTANLLLSGKLLTNDQKKALIKRMGFDLDNLSS
jgi:hypothetical protein